MTYRIYWSIDGEMGAYPNAYATYDEALRWAHAIELENRRDGLFNDDDHCVVVKEDDDNAS